MGFGKDHKGIIIREAATITVGGLTSKNVIKTTAGGVTLQTTSFRILKSQYFISVLGDFGAEGDEVLVGLCDGELAVAEIVEAININGPVDRNDNVLSEQANRPVFLLDQLKEAHDATTSYTTFGTGMKTFNPRWTFTPTEGWDWFVFNPLGGSLTAGLVILITAKHFGVWVD